LTEINIFLKKFEVQKSMLNTPFLNLKLLD
jgi:hypothetical protein